MSENAVKSQVWIGVSVYLLVAIVKKELGLPQSLHQMLQIFSLTQFEKTPLFSVFEKKNYNSKDSTSPSQLMLFDLGWDTTEIYRKDKKRKTAFGRQNNQHGHCRLSKKRYNRWTCLDLATSLLPT
jgi:hypothetical protein